MTQTVSQRISDLVRAHVLELYLKPAIQRGERMLTVSVGAVHKALSLNNRVPLVCAALKSKKFLQENGLRLVSKTGQSTTGTFTYEILEPSANPALSARPLMALRGVAKDLFNQLGGGEAFIRSERVNFCVRREK